MIKISRPVLYTVVAGVAAYAVVLLTEPEPVPKKHVVSMAASGPVAPTGFLPEDMTAKFPRYAAKSSAPFQPRVISARGLRTAAKPTAANPMVMAGGKGDWKLTGISSIDGVPNALMEDGNDEDSVFLHPGQVWRGLRVASIESDAIIFVNALGQPTRLPFIDPNVTPSPSALPTLPSGVTLPQKSLLPGPVPTQTANAPAPVTIVGDRAIVQPATNSGLSQGRNLR